MSLFNGLDEINKKDKDILIKESINYGLGSFSNREFSRGELMGEAFHIVNGNVKGSKIIKNIKQSKNPNVRLIRKGDTIFIESKKSIDSGEELFADHNTYKIIEDKVYMESDETEESEDNIRTEDDSIDEETEKDTNEDNVRTEDDSIDEETEKDTNEDNVRTEDESTDDMNVDEDDSSTDTFDDSSFDDEIDIGMKEAEEDEDIELRKDKYIKNIYIKTYRKYRRLIDTLESIDTTKDKKIILDELMDDYEETLTMLIEYHKNNNDPVVVKYQTLLEFRILFINLNNKLHILKELIEEED